MENLNELTQGQRVELINKKYLRFLIRNKKTDLYFYGYSYDNERNNSTPNTFQKSKTTHMIKRECIKNDSDVLDFKLNILVVNGKDFVINYVKSKSLKSEVYKEFIKHYSEKELDLIPLEDFEVIRIN